MRGSLAVVCDDGRQQSRDDEDDREHHVARVPAEEVEDPYQENYDPARKVGRAGGGRLEVGRRRKASGHCVRVPQPLLPFVQ